MFIASNPDIFKLKAFNKFISKSLPILVTIPTLKNILAGIAEYRQAPPTSLSLTALSIKYSLVS